MTVSQLKPGAHFSVAGTEYKLLRLSDMSAYVQILKTRRVRLSDGTEFDAPGKRVNISLGTEIEAAALPEKETL